MVDFMGSVRSCLFIFVFQQQNKVYPVHAMNAYMGSRGIAPLILNLGR